MQNQSGGHDVPDRGGTKRDAFVSGEEPVLRLAAPARYCGSCGVKAAPEDTFCIACGHALSAEDPNTADTAALAASSENEPALVAQPPVATRISAPRRRSRLAPVLPVAAGLLLAAAVALGALWRNETNHATRLQHRLDQTALALQQTRTSLASTQAKLRSTTALSAKQRAVLLQAQTVLARVDPLLSSVDGVQQRAADLQSQGTTLSNDAESLIQTTITLVNYLVEWGSDADTTYVNDLIDQANSELNAVRGDEGSFGGGTSAYDKASTTFGQKADAFSSAVRSLQKQLKSVAGP